VLVTDSKGLHATCDQAPAVPACKNKKVISDVKTWRRIRHCRAPSIASDPPLPLEQDPSIDMERHPLANSMQVSAEGFRSTLSHSMAESPLLMIS
jgi:hypothetical protein